MQVPLDSWNDVSGSAGVRNAERRLLRSLRQPSDGYLARFDRCPVRRAFASVDSTP